MPRPQPRHRSFTRSAGEYPRDEIDIGWAIAKVVPNTKRIKLADRFLPESIEVVSKDVPDTPSVRLRLDIIGGVPTCTEVEFQQVTSTGVRQVDLQTLNLTEIVSDVYAAMSWPMTIGPDGETIVLAIGGGTDDRRSARRTISGQQRRRTITPEFLQKVARLFTEHESHKPIVAISKILGCSERMAAKYVRMARDAGYLAEPKRKKGSLK